VIRRTSLALWPKSNAHGKPLQALIVKKTGIIARLCHIDLFCDDANKIDKYLHYVWYQTPARSRTWRNVSRLNLFEIPPQDKYRNRARSFRISGRNHLGTAYFERERRLSLNYNLAWWRSKPLL
jgi:hypothetical protein